MKFRFFPAYLERPEKMHVAEQEPDEEIELLLRQHWFTNVPWIFYSIIAFFVPFVVLNIEIWLNLDFLPEPPFSVILASIIAWYMLITAYVTESFLHWYFNIYIVTNIHLIDIDFINLLNKSLVEVKLSDIESAAMSMRGVFSSLFNYGDVYVQTAADKQRITFASVPYPALVVDRINDLRTGHHRPNGP